MKLITKKAAVWASLESMCAKIELDVDELDHLFIITDSPTSQYRNAGCMFLAKRYAEMSNVDVSWVFTETCHGKGSMDGVGAAIKNSIDNAVIAAESMPNVSVRSAADVAPILNLVNVDISQYNANDIADMAKKLPAPKTLSISCKTFGISKVHEIFLQRCLRTRLHGR